jgi:oligopeptide transport system substrate-binding protein
MATDTASVTVIATRFEGLTRLDATGNVVPGAADWTVSDDGKTYTFTLKDSTWCVLSGAEQDSPWSETIPVTADDFLFAIQRAVDPITGSPVAAEFDLIQNAKAIRTGKKKLSTLGVKTPDDKTLVITLTQADEGFPAALAGTPFMPCNRAFFEYTGGRYGLEKEYVLSNGAFTLASWSHNESLLLSRSEHYPRRAEIYPAQVRLVINAAGDMSTLLSNGTLDAGETNTVTVKSGTSKSPRLAWRQRRSKLNFSPSGHV